MTGSFSTPRRATAVLALGLIALAACSAPVYADWLAYRGPSSNGASPEKGLNTKFPIDGPKVLWTATVGTGTSSITVSGNHAYTMGNTGGHDRVVCFDVKTGAEVWKYEYPLELDKRMFEGGTAATPTIDGDRVYTVSHQGDLFCFDAGTGKKLWYRHYQQDLGGRRPQWGFAGSPAVEENLLILDVGGKGASTVALDKLTGNVVWKSGDDQAGYASPVVATIGGKRTAVLFKADSLVGLDVKDGRELWRSPWKTNYDVNAATPLIVGDRIFISSGYGSGCALIEISGGKAVEKWRNKNLKAHLSSPVYSKGFVYGIDNTASASSPLVCLDFASGQEKWSQRGIGGALIAADGKLIILSELGEIIVAEDTATGFKPSARAQVLPKRCWVQPTLANGRVFCRNNEGHVACLDFGAK
jgi:outer membrane protein assembly factor BamB